MTSTRAYVWPNPARPFASQSNPGLESVTAIALAMVLVAAFFHACWNYLAKKSPNKMIFIWWFLLADPPCV
jgi:hypothetical protein